MVVDHIFEGLKLAVMLAVMLGGFVMVIGVEAVFALALNRAIPTIPFGVTALVTFLGGLFMFGFSSSYMTEHMTVTPGIEGIWDFIFGFGHLVPVWWLIGTICFALVSVLLALPENSTPTPQAN